MSKSVGGLPELSPAPYWVHVAAWIVRHLPCGRYRLVHALPRGSAPFQMRFPKRSGGYSFRCDLKDTMSREVCFTGQFEPQETMLLRVLLSPGMTFVDVGANWGYHSLLASSLVTPGGRILSLEPDPRVFAVLAENIAANRLAPMVTHLPVAASDAVGELLLAGYREADGNYGISKVVTEASGAVTYKVRAMPLDDLLAERKIEKIDLMKMDIEGAERQALRGLKAGLSSHRVRCLLLELHPIQLAEQGSSVVEIIRYLQEFGYQGFWVDHTPAVTRQAAYAADLPPGVLLKKLESKHDVDPWPHTLWLAPGQKLPPRLDPAANGGMS